MKRDRLSSDLLPPATERKVYTSGSVIEFSGDCTSSPAATCCTTTGGILPPNPTSSTRTSSTPAWAISRPATTSSGSTTVSRSSRSNARRGMEWRFVVPQVPAVEVTEAGSECGTRDNSWEFSFPGRHPYGRSSRGDAPRLSASKRVDSSSVPSSSIHINASSVGGPGGAAEHTTRLAGRPALREDV